MENKCHSSDVRKRERLNLYLTKSASPFFKSGALIDFNNSAKRKDADLHIDFTSKFNITFPKTKLSLTQRDFDDTAKHLQNVAELSYKSSDVNYFNYTFSEDASVVFKGAKNIQTLLQNFSKSSFLKQFNSCQFLVHEKGHSRAFSITLKNSQIHNRKFFTTTSFNNIFAKIKKSKNKQFSVNEIISENLEIIGSFLAKEFEHKDFNFIILASRGELFSTSKEDKEVFTRFITSYQDIFFSAVASTIQEIHIEQSSKIIRDFPIYLAINTQSNQWVSKIPMSDNVKQIKSDGLTIEYAQQNFMDTEADLYHQERIILMGELLNTLRHELSNPLFGIQIASEMLTMDSQDHDMDTFDLIGEIKNSSLRCQSIIENFSGLYLANTALPNISLKNLIEETLVLTKSETKFYKKSVIFESFDDIEVCINPTFLSQIIFNLVINSSQALKTVDKTDKEIRVLVRGDLTHIHIFILDNGPGLQQSEAEKVFTPFYTSKENGTGLGLSICKRLAQKLSGELKVNFDFSPWTCFELVLPNVESLR